MASSEWIDVAPIAVILPTTRMYFGAYLYRAKIVADYFRNAARFFTTDFKQFEYRLGKGKKRRYGDDPVVNTVLLHSLLLAKRSIAAKDVQFRICHPHLLVYSKTPDDLMCFLEFSKIIGEATVEIHQPLDQHCIDVLVTDKILLSKDNGYKYKVRLTEGMHTVEIKQQVHDYLASLGTDVKMTAGTKRSLTNGQRWLGGVTVFFNDPNVLVFIKMISPFIVGKVSEFSVMPQISDK